MLVKFNIQLEYITGSVTWETPKPQLEPASKAQLKLELTADS